MVIPFKYTGKVVFAIVISLLGCFSSTSYCQEIQDSILPVRLDKSYAKSYWTDGKRIITAPFHWGVKDWIITGSVIGVTALLYTQDEKIQDFFQRNQNDFWDASSKYLFEPAGSGLIAIPLIGGCYIFGKITRSERAERVALTSAKSLILTGAVTYAIKYLTQRYRPSQHDPPDPKLWEGPFGSYKYEAFPSGHTTLAFSVATVFASEYKDKLWVPILAYTLATGAGLSRIYDNKHWASDILIGAALGFGIGKLVYRSSINNYNFTIIPTVCQNFAQAGILVQIPISYN